MRSSFVVLVVLAATSALAQQGKLDFEPIKRLEGMEKLDALLRAPYVEDLTEFARKEHSEENLNFILQVAPGGLGEKDKQAIYNRFIAVKAPEELNISAQEKTVLRNQATASQWQAMKFKVALREVKALMLRDTVKRYMRGK